MRLLAAAVNSALGMAPVYVDVTSIGDAAVRARYTPEVLASADALHRVAAERGRAAAARRGMLVHLRRRLAGSYFLGEPPELQLARDACRDLGVPITIQGATLPRRIAMSCGTRSATRSAASSPSSIRARTPTARCSSRSPSTACC